MPADWSTRVSIGRSGQRRGESVARGQVGGETENGNIPDVLVKKAVWCSFTVEILGSIPEDSKIGKFVLWENPGNPLGIKSLG